MTADESSYNRAKPTRKAAKTARSQAQVTTQMNVESVDSGTVAPALLPARLGTTLSLMLVDDHAILREGLRALLELEPDFKVVGEAASYDEAVIMAARLQPDVVLTDIGRIVGAGNDRNLPVERRPHESDRHQGTQREGQHCQGRP